MAHGHTGPKGSIIDGGQHVSSIDRNTSKVIADGAVDILRRITWPTMENFVSQGEAEAMYRMVHRDIESWLETDTHIASMMTSGDLLDSRGRPNTTGIMKVITDMGRAANNPARQTAADSLRRHALQVFKMLGFPPRGVTNE
jgi:hypothetical protein